MFVEKVGLEDFQNFMEFDWLRIPGKRKPPDHGLVPIVRSFLQLEYASEEVGILRMGFPIHVQMHCIYPSSHNHGSGNNGSVQ